LHIVPCQSRRGNRSLGTGLRILLVGANIRFGDTVPSLTTECQNSASRCWLQVKHSNLPAHLFFPEARVDRRAATAPAFPKTTWRRRPCPGSPPDLTDRIGPQLRMITSDPGLPLIDFEFLGYRTKRGGASNAAVDRAARTWHGLLLGASQQAATEIHASRAEPEVAAPHNPDEDPVSQLERISRLRDGGHISADEFKSLKQQTINRGR
jgi:hypothetical protein